MTKSANQESSSPVAIKVVFAGVEKSDWPIDLVQVRSTLGAASSALIELSEPASDEGALFLFEAPELQAGMSVEIHVGYGADLPLIFSGHLVTYGLSLQDRERRVAIECVADQAANAPEQATVALTATWGENIFQYEAEMAGRGRMIVPGSAQVLPGAAVQVRGVGRSFDGDFEISAATQEISEGNWLTQLEYGGEEAKASAGLSSVAAGDCGGVLYDHGGFKVLVDEASRSVLIQTPYANQLVLSDDSKSCRLQDSNGNSLVLGAEGIALESQKDISIKALGRVSISGLQGVDVASSGGDVKVNAINVVAQANATLKVCGSASAEISASGETVVKGAMVLIN
jgi:hypothetical protein